MKKRIIIIDDSQNLRAKIARLLQLDMPELDITEYNVTKMGWHPNLVRFKQYHLIIIADRVANQNVLPWVESRCDEPDFPAVIMLSQSLDDDHQDKVKALGVFHCLDKTHLTRSSLEGAVKSAFEATEEPDMSSSDSHWSLDTLARPSLENYTPPEEDERKLRKPRPRPKHQVIDQERRRFSNKKSTVLEIPGYTILEKIGQGGMSVIYLALREADQAKVVVKVLSANLSENDTQVIRSNLEYQLISRINSPHIVKLHDHGIVDGATYTVMEHFTSGDLKQRMKAGITQVEALKFMKEICQGLAAIHGSGIIHRDLKPANIMFREDDTLAILDFGISKDINSQLNLTLPGQVIGTPNYMAPEQGTSGYKPDARSDIYAAGVMLFEMLTGKKPYRAANAASIIYKHLNDPIPKLPNQFFEMQGLIDNCMAKFPHQRFQSAIDMIEYIRTEFRWDITLDFDQEYE